MEVRQLKNISIRKIKEEKVQVAENKTQNKIEIAFDSEENGIVKTGTITFSGDGSLKVLTTV